MTDISPQLSRIEAILAEIERLDAATGGQFRQASDREAFDTAARMERRMIQHSQNVTRETQESDQCR